MSDNICFICHENEGTLISPCGGCRGTGGYVHSACLMASFVHRGEWFDLSCRQCKHGYYGEFGVDLAKLALQKVQEEHGETSAYSACMMVWLGVAFYRSGDYGKQKEVLELALTIEEREYGTDHVEVAKTLAHLASALGNLGDYRKAKELLERALTIKEREYGTDHVEVARTLNNLASFLDSLGDHRKPRSCWSAR